VPEVDHPGIPATIVVEDGLAEVLLEGESLGRWSLYDVHAARLVSSAFSISLDGEEITFIADEPVDFAYKGVEHMAGVWARYKAMTMPRRVVAVGRSRRGTMPSRIPELREAMLSNLRTVGVLASPTAPDPAVPESHPQPAPWARRLDAYSNVPAPIDEVTDDDTDDPAVPIDETTSDEPDLPVPDDAELDETDAPQPENLSQPAQPAPLRPGPGLIPREVRRITPVPSSHSAEPPDWEAAWEEPPDYELPAYDDLPHDADLVYFDEEPGLDETPAAEDETVTPVSTDETPPPAGSDAESMPAAATRDEITPGRGTDPRETVLDLGRLEVDHRQAAPVPPPEMRAGDEVMPEPDLELLFAGAPLPEGERSGLFGAVRSAFARNRGGAHEHQFVEAPGGIGIVRQICAECGYISIGVSD
jgi:hypothetical protein